MDEPASKEVIPVPLVTAGIALRRKIAALRKIKPEWAVDCRAINGQLVLEVFVYDRPAQRAKGFHDLKEIRQITFPVMEGRRLLLTPGAWVDEQIRRLTTPNVPAAIA